MDPRKAFSALAVACMGIATTVFVLVNVPPAYATTITVTGWLVPDATHWNNGFGALLFPLIGVGLLGGIGAAAGVEKEFSVTLILAGLTVGGLLAMLSLTSSSANILPFALVIVPGADLLVWMWKGGG